MSNGSRLVQFREGFLAAGGGDNCEICAGYREILLTEYVLGISENNTEEHLVKIKCPSCHPSLYPEIFGELN